MTYEENDVVTLLKIAIEDPRDDDYVIFNESEALSSGGGGGGGSPPCASSSRGGGCSVGVSFWCSVWWWLKIVFVLIFLAVLGVCFFLWIGPFLMNKVCCELIIILTTLFN